MVLYNVRVIFEYCPYQQRRVHSDLRLGGHYLFLAFVAPTDWLGALFKVYAVLLIPFFIVNGILTGTGIEEPIVWYNNDEIIGFRMLTIPVEDTFYGFLLILLNVYFYERFKMLSAFITL